MNERQTDEYKAILDLFAKTCPGLPVPDTVTDEVYRWIAEAANELKRRNSRFTDLFQKVAASDYLMGRKAGSNFVARFGWVVKPEVIGNILAGKYDDREKRPAARTIRTRDDHIDIGYQYLDYLPDRDGRWTPPIPDEWKDEAL